MDVIALPAYAPFVLLGAAMVALLLSTRQWPLWLRVEVWLIGAVLLGLAGWLSVRDSHAGLFGLFADAVRGNPLDSALIQTLTGNGGRISNNLAPMFGILFAPALALAALCLIAFSKGERLEKVLRPVLYIGIGAIGGGFLALTIVALGLGGYYSDRTYAARGANIAVIDGDTIRMGDVTLRLWGIDAPERDQICLQDIPGNPSCGDKATGHLKALIAGAHVVCGPPPGRERPAETFGRPLVICHAYGPREVFDIAERMAGDGYADVYRQSERAIVSSYCRDVRGAQTKGLWKLGLLQPSLWRNDPDARLNFFEDQHPPVIDEVLKQCAEKEGR